MKFRNSLIGLTSYWQVNFARRLLNTKLRLAEYPHDKRIRVNAWDQASGVAQPPTALGWQCS
ncbi:MAG: hypothetical protein ACTH5C_21110 [Pseudoalteromonas prydzensis]|uniref:hypothetical protein n=1 Tax=Pseudoalteromonas prydzensis TaxID=182141 RepID=UPI003F99A10C